MFQSIYVAFTKKFLFTNAVTNGYPTLCFIMLMSIKSGILIWKQTLANVILFIWKYMDWLIIFIIVLFIWMCLQDLRLIMTVYAYHMN